MTDVTSWPPIVFDAESAKPTVAADPVVPNAVWLMPGTTIWQAQRELVECTLRHTDGNKRIAAEMLGIAQKTLYNWLTEYRIADKVNA